MNKRYLLMMAIGIAGISFLDVWADDFNNSSSKALFSEFDYSGFDRYYWENPLPSESAYFNPILPGWYSDPTVCTNGDGDYYLATSTFAYFPGVPLFHSRDLMNWEQIGHILDRPSQLQNIEGQGVSRGIFAPALAYNPANKTYYMITTNVGAGNFLVKATDPAGKWSDPIMLPEVAGIDPSLFFDTDGKAYIINNDDAPDNKPEYDGHRTVRMVEYDVNTDKCVGERRILIDKGCRPEEKPIWCEGPHMYKINGTYYLMTAEGGTGDWHSEVIYRSDSPWGPFQAYDGNPILTQRTLAKDRENPVTCAGHADLIQAKEGDWWAVFLACRPIEGKYENLGRETFIVPVTWTADGWPEIVREGDLVPGIVEREGTTRHLTTSGNFSVHTAFNTPQPGHEWMTLRHAGDNVYSLKDNPGFLSLSCAEVNTSDKSCPAFVCRRLQHHEFEATTAMSFIPQDEKEYAGMVIFKDESHQYMICRSIEDDIHKIWVGKVGMEGMEVIAIQNIPEASANIGLKIKSNGKELTFYYSPENNGEWSQLATNVDASYTSTAQAGGFTGTTVGLYASSKKFKYINTNLTNSDN